jgi:hypothetical protein
LWVFFTGVAIKHGYRLGIGKDELEIVDEQRADVTRQELVDDLRFAALVVCLVIARHETNNAAYEEYIS